MFKNLQIEGFRGIRRLEMPNLGRINLLVGQNCSGKTSVLEALFLLTNPGNPQLPLNINLFRGVLPAPTNESTWPLIFHQLNVRKPIRFSADLHRPRERRDLVITPSYQSPALTTFKSGEQSKVQEQVNGNFSGSETLVNGLIIDFSISEPGKGKLGKKHRADIAMVDNKLKVTVAEGYEPNLRGVFHNWQIMTAGIGDRFHRLQVEKRKDMVLAVLRQVEPGLADLTLGTNGAVFADVGLEKMIPANVLGDGLFKMLSVILAMHDSRDGVVLVDEMENGLHHRSLHIFWRAIAEAAKEFNVQVFATTHSIECLAAMDAVIPADRDLAKDWRLYRIEKSSDGHRAISFDCDSLSSALESKWEIR